MALSPICEDLLLEQELTEHEAACPGPQASSSNSKPVNSHGTKPLQGASQKRKASALGIKGKSAAIQDVPEEREQSGSKNAHTLKKFKTSTALERAKPLPERVRPKTLDEVVGQSHLLRKGALLRSLIDKDAVGQSLQSLALPPCFLSRIIGSMVLWGPPGTGKVS